MLHVSKVTVGVPVVRLAEEETDDNALMDVVADTNAESVDELLGLPLKEIVDVCII